MDLTEAGNIKKRWQDYTEELQKKILMTQIITIETTVRTGHGTMDWFKIGKGVCHGSILSLCLFNLYEEYIMSNAGGMNHKL